MKSSEKRIISFSFNSLNPPLLASIDSTNQTITAIVPATADLKKMVPTIKISEKATVSPASDVAQDFSNGDVNYTVTAEDGSTQVYVVRVETPKAKIENNLLVYFGVGSEITSLNAQNGKDLKSIIKFRQCCSQAYIPLNYADGILLAKDYFGDLFAINAQSGDVLWTLNHPHVNVSQPPLIDGKTVYYSSMLGLEALDIKTGKIKWNSADVFSLTSSPRISEGTIYVGTTESLFALNVDDGKKKWEVRKNQRGENFFSRPEINNQTVFIGNTNGDFYAFDGKTAKEKWVFKTGGEIFSSAKVAGGKVFFGSTDSYFYAVDAETGKLIWRFLADGPVYSSPTVANGAVYFVGKNKLYSLRLADGVENVTYNVTINSQATFTSPVIANGVIYIPTTQGYLRAIDAFTGKIIWEYQAGFIPQPIIIGKDGEVFVSGAT